MKIIIENKSDQPIYEQLYEQVAAQILNKELKANDGLPSIRLIAKELNISVITVKSAYDNLLKEGFIYSVLGKGYFVNDISKLNLIKKRNELLNNSLSNKLKSLKNNGFEKEDIIKIVNNIFN